MNYEQVLESFESTDPAIHELGKTLAKDIAAAPAIRDSLSRSTALLEQQFADGVPVADLVRSRSQLVDFILASLWHSGNASDRAALVAVGGYGRGELHPGSDVDLLLLLPEQHSEDDEKTVSEFVTRLWDLGLEIGHSVRNVADCVNEASADITVATSLMEARLVLGPDALFEQLVDAISGQDIWPADRFFAAKRDEQRARHKRYDDTAYKLEPNVKGSPGGLRDIQMIGWVTQRQFGNASLSELVAHDFLTPGQLRILEDGRTFLWRVRFALHLAAGRREDRLLFDHQVKIASMLGYEDASYTLGVEQLMQRYYRTVMDLSRLNEMLLQQFEEAILLDPAAAPEGLNARFQVKNGYLQTRHDEVFRDDPSALLEVFLLLQRHDLKGVSAYTVGLIKRSLYLIDEQFRQSPRNHRLFLDILRAPEGVTHELRRMNLYGVLGLYIPAFGRIVGRMQYDLFHAYTVDEHTLFVVSNLHKFALQRFNDEYPDCSQLMQSLDKPEITYLAGLFHDIAKGRGGDHSELGATDAEAFCLEHGMSNYDARTVAWLVRQHLALSMTAQKKDISDPDVITEFASLVGDQAHLDYLYLLTVADVRGTNPSLWNSWKATLFRDLYDRTTSALRRGIENPIDADDLVEDAQASAQRLLDERGVDDARVSAVWALLTNDYFLRTRPGEIAWHTEVLADSDTSIAHGLVDVRRQPQGDGLEVLLYSPRSKRTFAHATAVLDQLGLTIADARIVPLKNEYSLDTYIVLELDARIETDDSRLSKIRRTLARILTTTDDNEVPVTRPLSRQARVFRTQPSVHFSTGRNNRHTIMELVAGDHPGLLSKVGGTFIEQGIDIEMAKIVTIGERAEDVFYLLDESGAPLDEAACERLRDALLEKLGQTG